MGKVRKEQDSFKEGTLGRGKEGTLKPDGRKGKPDGKGETLKKDKKEARRVVSLKDMYRHIPVWPQTIRESELKKRMGITRSIDFPAEAPILEEGNSRNLVRFAFISEVAKEKWLIETRKTKRRETTRKRQKNAF